MKGWGLPLYITWLFISEHSEGVGPTLNSLGARKPSVKKLKSHRSGALKRGPSQNDEIYLIFS